MTTSSDRTGALRNLALASVALAVVQAAQAATPSSAIQQKADHMAEMLVSRMTLDEKLPQLLNVAPAIPRLNIPAYNWWTESLHGAIGTLPTTNFPEPIGLAASFDTRLVHQVAADISLENRGLHTLARQTGRAGHIGAGLDTWSPNINIFRDPRWGRGQETYGEDPFLTARMAVAFVTGMQGTDPVLPDVISTPKHFAVHSGPESTRHMADVEVSPHDLEDTYLPAFRAAIVEAKANSVMCAYNSIDGAPACASDLLLKAHLRQAWGFKGYVVSDCDAVKDIATGHHYAPDPAAAVAAAMKAGVDNECNVETLSDTAGLTGRYREALQRGLMTEADVDRGLVRLFSARLRTGDLAGLRSAAAVSPDVVGGAAQGSDALKAAEESLVLLKNDGVLPLRSGLKVAVIGPLGDSTRVLRGNYSSPLSAPPVSVLDGLRRAMPNAEVSYAPFSPSYTDGDRVPTSALQTPDGHPGVLVRRYNPSGHEPKLFPPGGRSAALKTMRYQATPVVSRVEPEVGRGGLDLAQISDLAKTTWTGVLVPPESGAYRLGLTGSSVSLTLDGRLLATTQDQDYGVLATLRTVRLEKGRRYPFQIEARGGGADLVWKRVSDDAAADLKRAAAGADVIVAVVGLTSDLEAEESSVKVPGFSGGDKTTLDLPADQQSLLVAAKALGKPLVVVAMNGSPLNFAWEKANADALVEAWYPGQSGGLAVGEVLAGQVDPGGRLPLTFYRSLDDLPPFDDYDMKGRTYRYFTGSPVYPFGFGLSYTRFDYAPLSLQPAQGDSNKGLVVTTALRNIGTRAGEEVAQLYLNFPNAPGTPRVALRGFQRVALQPGQMRTLQFELSPRDLSAVTPDGVRRVLAGHYRVSVGSGQPGTGVPIQSAGFTSLAGAPLPQ
jgi:beta-glucosidase